MDIPESKIKQQNTYNENDDQDSIDLIYKEESEDKSQDNKTNDEENIKDPDSFSDSGRHNLL